MAMFGYLKVRGSHSGPLFYWQSGSPLSKSNFVDKVRSALTKANLPADNFAGHSFRVGAATTAASAGICDSSIQSLGQWKSNYYISELPPNSWQESLLQCQLQCAIFKFSQLSCLPHWIPLAAC